MCKNEQTQQMNKQAWLLFELTNHSNKMLTTSLVNYGNKQTLILTVLTNEDLKQTLVKHLGEQSIHG